MPISYKLNINKSYFRYYTSTFCYLFIFFSGMQLSLAKSNNCPYADKDITKQQFQSILMKHNELINEHSDLIENLDGNLNKINALKKILKSDPRYANLCSSNLIKRQFIDTNLYAANFNNAALSNSNFKYANLELASFVDANLSHANLSNAMMTRVNLKNANLYRAEMFKTSLFAANLSHADLSNSNLQEVKLSDANLAGANLSYAKLINAYMSYATLVDAQLIKADLSNAILKDSDLTNTLFIGANLSNVDLEDANLSYTNFKDSNLQGVNYLPSLISYPQMGNLALNHTLHLLTYEENSSGLYHLRNQFKKLGFRDAERKLTFAIRHAQHSQSTQSGFIKYIDGYFNYLFFEFPTNWSMNPEKSIIILLILILVFTLPYSISIYRPRTDGIWRIWNATRIRQDLGHDEPILLSAGLFKSLLIGFQFSVLSAFHIGWKDLNVGHWINSIQSREYSFYATGWVRSVSGVQSLISVYLIAAWALTYFGRPFE